MRSALVLLATACQLVMAVALAARVARVVIANAAPPPGLVHHHGSHLVTEAQLQQAVSQPFVAPVLHNGLGEP
jgi:hypothetical protein